MFKSLWTCVLSAALIGTVSMTAPNVLADGPAETGGIHIRKVYRVGDLPVWAKDGQFRPTLLIHMITTTVTPEQWGSRPGSAAIAPYAPAAALVVTASPETHSGIKHLVDMNRGIHPFPVPLRANAKGSE